MRNFDVYRDFLTLRSQARFNDISAPAVEEEAVADSVLRFIKADRNRPFFAVYFMFWNHAPYRLPFEDISSLTPRERYRRGNEYLDQILRGLIATARREGLLDNTILIAAADHGEGFALYHDNVNHVGHIYQEDVRIPLLIHLPGLGRHVTDRLGSTVDFAPTVASLLDLPRPASWQGQDLLAPAFSPRPVLLYGRSAVAANGLVDGNYKYIEYLDGSKRLLCDIERDPHEQRNLATERASQVSAYHALIKSWLPVVEYRALHTGSR